MEKKILDAMKKAGKPVRPGDIAKTLGLESKEVSKLISQLKKDGTGIADTELWTNADNSVKFSTPVLKDNLFIGLSERNKLFCIDTKNGKTLWNQDIDGRQGFGSVVTTGSVAMVLTPKGDLIIFELDGTGFNGQDLQTLTGVASTTALAIENIRLNESLQDSYKSTVKALVSLVDAKETYGGGHSRRVSEYALMGATSLLISEEEKQTIEYAAILHDIGKLSIPDNMLNKSDALTDEEWKIIREHPVIGSNLLRGINP